jgi:hypothetical protein
VATTVATENQTGKLGATHALSAKGTPATLSMVWTRRGGAPMRARLTEK